MISRAASQSLSLCNMIARWPTCLHANVVDGVSLRLGLASILRCARMASGYGGSRMQIIGSFGGLFCAGK